MDNIEVTMRWMMWLLSALLITSTGAIADPAFIERAKKDVLQKLNDPGSARFDDVVVREKNGLTYVCGRVNAKNRLGGYDGFKPFLYSSVIKSGALIYDGDAITDDPLSKVARINGFDDHCGP
jgi:hypothetical protein